MNQAKLLTCFLFSALFLFFSSGVKAQGPTCTITSIAAPATMIYDSIPFTITFSRNVTGFVGTDIQLINGTLIHLTPAAGPASVYQAFVKPADCNIVECKVFAGAAQDSLGLQSQAALPLEVRFDTCRPTITFTAVNGNPTGSNPIPLHIEFSESVTGFTATDIEIDSGSVSGGLSNYLGLDSLFTTAIQATGLAAVKVVIVAVDSGAITDPVGLSNDSTAIVLVYDPQFVGVQTFHDHADLQVYPNPGPGQWQVNFPGESLTSWKIIDPTGTVVKEGALSHTGMADASELPSGAYLLLLAGEKNRLLRKVIIQH